MAPSIQPAETLVVRPDATVELLADHPSLAVSAGRFARGAAPPPLHAHAEHTEVFLVLDGALRFVVECKEMVAGADTIVVVPPDVEHTFRAESEARFLDVHAPSSGYGAFVSALSAEAGGQQASAHGAFDRQPGADGAINVHAPACGFADYLREQNPGFDQHEPPPGGGADPTSVVVRTFETGA